MKAPTPHVDPIPPRPGNDNWFDDGVVFGNFLKALIEHCSNDLAQMNNPNEIQALSNHPEIRKYKDIILNKHFAVRWKTLYAKCSMDDTQPHLKSMLKKALIINTAVDSQSDLSAFFNESRFLPPHQAKNDMQSASLQQTSNMPKKGHNKLVAIDFFSILHPELEKLEACKQFSCLSREGRAVFDKLEQVQDVIYSRMTPLEKQRDQQNLSVGEKRSRVN